MPRPKTKSELLEANVKNFESLFAFIEKLPEECREKKYDLNGRDETIADVLCHLHEWHVMMEKWYNDGMSGKKPVMPREGYTWQTVPEMNREIWKQYQGTSLKDAEKLLKKSHKKMMDLIEEHSDEELFTKKMYPWTGTTSLGSYFVSATSSHYDWALKTIKPLQKLSRGAV